MTKYKVEWEASHMTIVEADNVDDARNIARQIAEIDRSYMAIIDGTFEAEIDE